MESRSLVDPCRWLGQLPPDVTLLRDIPLLPASHNSAAYKAGKGLVHRLIFLWGKCQCHPTIAQLQSGVRLLDVRWATLRNVPRTSLTHTGLLDPDLPTLFSDVTTFIKDHPSEFVVVYLRRDHHHRRTADPSKTARDIAPFLPFISSSPLRYGGIGSVPLSEARGTMLLISDEPLGAIPVFLSPGSRGWGDLWRCSTYREARRALQRLCARPPESEGGRLGGIAVDAAVHCLPPRLTSPWLLRTLTDAPLPRHVGVLMLDFVTREDLLPFLSRNACSSDV
eukprot:Sspe_Gene.119184::Locus_114471_Transcript_1_1_Confidence_1.000_Length_940::g.119184::m.119184/K01771/plc; 1-phosphatidylinositol phosphodiesterase